MHLISKNHMKERESEEVPCSVLVDDSGVIKDARENQSDGSDLGRGQLAAASLCRL